MAAPTSTTMTKAATREVRLLSTETNYILGNSVDGHILASQTDQTVARIVLPFPCRILQIDYYFLLSGSTHTLANIEAKVNAVAKTSAYTAADTGAASMNLTDPQAVFAALDVITLEADTNANSTISAVAMTVSVLPIFADYPSE